MKDSPPDPKPKSAARHAFELYLRTGRRRGALPAERKFNPYHDPRNGQFTFAPGGPRSIADPVFSDRRGLWKPKKKRPVEAKLPHQRLEDATSAESLERILNAPSFTNFGLANQSRGPNRGRGPSGRRGTDPVLLDHAFPGLSKSPAGAIIRLADSALELGSAADAATRELHDAQVRRLQAEIREIEPDFDIEAPMTPDTIEGRTNQIKHLRMQRALAYYRRRGDVRPLQVEVLRTMQDRADIAYLDAVEQYNAGRLTPRLSREEAIGNYIDAAVRTDLRKLFNVNRIDISAGQPVRVVGREYDTSGSDRSYRIPDARVGTVAFDVTLTAKSLKTAQVRGFFNTDFQPSVVVIIRPRQLGGLYTYAIKRPDK